jgi:hypothetical protein
LGEEAAFDEGKEKQPAFGMRVPCLFHHPVVEFLQHAPILFYARCLA